MNVHPIRTFSPQSFAVQVRLHRGTAPAQEVAFQRRVEAWLVDHDLHLEGGQTSFGVVAERDLSPTDQADVVIALLADPAVREVRMGPLVADPDDLSLEVTGLVWVEAGQFDPLVDAARTLYEAGRLSGAGFLRALGGYIYRAEEQVGVAI